MLSGSALSKLLCIKLVTRRLEIWCRWFISLGSFSTRKVLLCRFLKLRLELGSVNWFGFVIRAPPLSVFLTPWMWSTEFLCVSLMSLDGISVTYSFPSGLRLRGKLMNFGTVAVVRTSEASWLF